MPNHGDFSSLLQLGVGIGIGLSVFRAPVQLRANLLSTLLEGEISALGNATSQFARKKRRRFLMLDVRLRSVRSELERTQFPFLVATVGGAALNLGSLIFVALSASSPASSFAVVFYITVSVIYYLIVLAALEILARRRLSPLSREAQTIQEEKEK